ncbi:MAG: sulfotransferase [Nitriliruptorales bacterium]|nr:sulfotransferase [Nitriliruptorales bacterium]
MKSFDQHVEEATAATGLDDFGEPRWEPALRVLLDALASEAHLNDLGQIAVDVLIAERLANRLRIADWARQHPVHEVGISRPLIVMGMARTGSTLLHALLDADPANRSLMKWEVLDSIPPATDDTFTTDPRIAASVAKTEATFEAVPHLKAQHWEPGDGPTECTFVYAQDFRSLEFPGYAHVPTYTEFLLADDLASRTDWHALTLQVLGSQTTGRWNLKAPGHLLGLDVLRAAYPDARFVVTHRDPRNSVGSCAHMITDVWQYLSDGAAPRAGDVWHDLQFESAHRLLTHRSEHGDDGFFDVLYDRFTADPIAEIRRLYAHFGDELTPEAEAAMTERLAGRPHGMWGTYTYDLADHGIDERQVLDRFADYIEAFDIPITP